MCKVASVVHWSFHVKFETMFRGPIVVVTIRPGEFRRERGKEITECPRHNDVIVTVEKKYDDQR